MLIGHKLEYVFDGLLEINRGLWNSVGIFFYY